MAELPVHERQRCIETFRASQPLHRSFPLLLANEVSVPTPKGVCSKCHAEIAPDMTRGRVSWPIPGVAVIDAAGYCEPCQQMTQLYLRVRPAGDTYRAEAQRPDGRGWVFVQPPPPTWWRRLRRWLVQRMVR